MMGYFVLLDLVWCARFTIDANCLRGGFVWLYWIRLETLVGALLDFEQPLLCKVSCQQQGSRFCGHHDQGCIPHWMHVVILGAATLADPTSCWS